MIPSCIRLIRKGGKWKEVEKVLFESYVFVELDGELSSNDYYDIIDIHDVINILGVGKEYVYLDEHEVEHIKMLYGDGNPFPVLNKHELGKVEELGAEIVECNLRQKRCTLSFNRTTNSDVLETEIVVSVDDSVV